MTTEMTFAPTMMQVVVTVEQKVYEALMHLAEGQVFPDVAPSGTNPPYITFQAIGGAPVNYLSGEIPDKENTRMQVNVWASTRLSASTIGKQVEDALRTAPDLQTEVITGRTATYDEMTKYLGTMQDFSFWL